MDSTGKNSILITDDDKSNLEVLISILNPDYTVYTTKSGTAAPEMAGKFFPDLILLDVLMPDMNGFDVLAALKASGKTAHIPVIFISGLDSAEDVEKGLDLGAVDFIQKPFINKLVKTRVKSQLQIVNQNRELAKLRADLRETINSAGKVLVVDDVEMNLVIVKEMISPYGLLADTAANGHEAVEKIKANDYDLVLMDHVMPEMDGLETIQVIRKLGGGYEALPVIAITANVIDGMKEQFMANGFNGFISKPVRMNELIEVLKQWIAPEKMLSGKKKI